MYRPILVTPPASLPLTLEAAKAHCRVDDSDSDALLTALIASATSDLDGWTGILVRCLMPQTWRQDFDCFARCLRLPLAPVTAVVSVGYVDAAGADRTVDPGNYSLREDSAGSYLRFANAFAWPSISAEGHAVSVAYTAGYPVIAGDPDADPPTSDQPTVPPAILQAMLLTVGQWYANRELMAVGTIDNTLPAAADALLAKFRREQL